MDDVPDGISTVVFGGPKVGKSSLGDTAPKPLLVIDAEGGSRFTPSRKIKWNPEHPPPVADGTWETAVVNATSFRSVQLCYDLLVRGDHPFKGVTIDSISEVQQRAIDNMVGANKMDRDAWGDLLRIMSELIRSFRDLTVHPTHPLDAVTFIAMARQDKDTKIWKPYAQGQLSVTLPYYVDVCAYLAVLPATEMSPKTRRLYIDPIPGFETGERLNGYLGATIDNANITDMVATLRAAVVDKEGTITA